MTEPPLSSLPLREGKADPSRRSFSEGGRPREGAGRLLIDSLRKRVLSKRIYQNETMSGFPEMFDLFHLFMEGAFDKVESNGRKLNLMGICRKRHDRNSALMGRAW